MAALQSTPPLVAPLARHGRTRRYSDPAQLTARLATDKQTKRDVYELRYLSYVSEGHIEARRSGLFSDEFDGRPEVRTVVIYKGARAVASTRLCVLTRGPDGAASGAIPARDVFPAEIEALFRTDTACPVRRVVEINRLVRHPEFSGDRSLVFLLFRLAGHFILQHDPGAVVSCVRRNHVPFYARLRFSEVAGPRVYHGVRFATHLLACPRERYDAVRRMVPVLDLTGAERERYDRLVRGERVAVLPC